MVKRIDVYENILEKNDLLAKENREFLDSKGVFSINLMASPGAGKTSLIELTIKELANQLRIAVIDGDIATSIDADRARAAGARAYQINTGGECHLDANMISEALSYLDLSAVDLLIVENVGNLICPASFKLGTHKNVLIASIPEGDDKPYKYPIIYRGIDALVLNKIDLLPYIEFDLEYFRRGVEFLNSGLEIFPLSCRTREGFDKWTLWIQKVLNCRKKDESNS